MTGERRLSPLGKTSEPVAPSQSPSQPSRRYLVPPWLEGRRLDQGLAVLAGVSRRRARALIDSGQLCLDSRPTRTLSRALATGNVLDLLPPHAGTTTPPAPPSVEIVFEDGWLVAVAKPAGVAAAAPRTRAPQELTMGEALALALSARAGKRVAPILIHRLDRATSGLMVFALHPRAAQGLAKAWQSGAVFKRYLAVVAGDPGEDAIIIEQPIARDPLTPGRFAQSPRGRPARTTVDALARGASHSLIEARPVTGRSHQIRVHLADSGWPIVGDTLYGGPAGTRLLLHAWRLDLPHPVTGVSLSLTASVPGDFAVHLPRFGLALTESVRVTQTLLLLFAACVSRLASRDSPQELLPGVTAAPLPSTRGSSASARHPAASPAHRESVRPRR